LRFKNSPEKKENKEIQLLVINLWYTTAAAIDQYLKRISSVTMSFTSSEVVTGKGKERVTGFNT
jgi:hypothetical protein